MDIQRIRREVSRAAAQFAYVEAHPTSDGGVIVKTALQTTAGNKYIAEIRFLGYPNQMPRVLITRPVLGANVPHQYNTGNICYLHSSMWNPGRHDLVFVIGRIAKWLNKYEVWRSNGGHWPGKEIKH